MLLSSKSNKNTWKDTNQENLKTVYKGYKKIVPADSESFYKVSPETYKRPLVWRKKHFQKNIHMIHAKSFLATQVALHFTPVSETLGGQQPSSVAWSLQACWYLKCYPYLKQKHGNGDDPFYILIIL